MKRIIYINACPELRNRAGYEVFTPTKRAARSMNVPELTLEGLALSILGKAKLRVAPAVIASQTLRAASSDVFDPHDAEAAARGLKPSLQTLLRTNVDLKALSNVRVARVQNLARVAESYRARLRKRNLVDSSEVLWRAVGCRPMRRKIHVYGYFRPRIDELSFIDAIADDGSEVVLPCTEHPIFNENREAVKYLEQLGWQVEDESRTPLTIGERLALGFAAGHTTGSEVPAHAYPHVEAEVRGVLAQIKSRIISGTPPDDIALVARDDSFYGPVVSAVAWEYGLPIRVLYAVPLSETRFGVWVRLLFEAILNDLPFEATARLLAQPLGPGLPDKQWAAVRARHPSGLARWQALGINLAPLANLPREDTRARWVEHFQQLLGAFEIGGRVGHWAREVLAYYTLQSELSALAELPTDVLNREEFAAEVMELLALVTVPAQPGSGGIELHTPLSLFGTRQAHLYVMGMGEGMLPATIAEDTLLDFRERYRLAEMGFELETAADAARREALSFFALLQTATQSITLSYPQTAQGRETIPSPYLARLGIDSPATTALPILSVSSPEEARRILLRHDVASEDPVLAHARHTYTVERMRESTAAHDEYDGVTGKPFDFTEHVWSASQLTRLGQCPFSWFSQYLLKLAEVEEAEDTLGAALRGNLYHKVLETALRSATRMADSQPESSLRELVLGGSEEAFRRAEKELGLSLLPAWDAQRAEHLAVLRRAVAGADFIKDGAVVLSPERKFEGEWYGLKVKGVVDRIDRAEDGLVLVDYKSGASLTPGPKDIDGKTRLDIQLPLYAHVISSALFNGEPVADAYYYSLSKSKVIKRSVSGDSAALEAFVERIKGYLREGRFPVEPDAERYACAYCDYDLVCRKGVRLERKGAAQ
jgi:RecB family exonuclease